ncbi:alpha/beta hydrolase [Pendulispora rubella]|uniref:Alpha/beta hydrolase n=1 Tax=Pendulispora rubella TaxID=2741070 RepID=A0ABZ2KPS7_9BACT
MVDPSRMPVVTMRDGRGLHVRVVGKGMPVLLLPGLGMSSMLWLPFVWPFAHRYRFILPDFRGFGRSSHLAIERDDVFESHAMDVRDVIAHLGLRDFLLGGISLGGTTALHMNHRAGLDGVRAYLHVEQSPCVGNRLGWRYGLFGERQDTCFDEFRVFAGLLGQYPEARELTDLPPSERARAAESLARIAAWTFGTPRLEAPLRRFFLLPTFLAGRFPLSLRDARTYIAAYLAGGHDYRSSLRNLAMPVTLMIGMKSTPYPYPGQMAIAESAPNVRVVRFERSGHLPLFEEPAKFVRELGRFLEHGSRASSRTTNGLP